MPILIAALAVCASAQVPPCIIQSETVGAVHRGMTAAQARAALPGATLEPAEDPDGLPMLSVTRDGVHTLLDLYLDVDEPRKERAKIELIRVFDAHCATRDGVRPGMPLAAVTGRYGRLRRVMTTESESREYAEVRKAAILARHPGG
ncbi:MAG TPA: hypothetical protein VE959_21315 [Bryobacteraceae bacterium]|nr:hypothetical protein [Bryobacteraceae bacterium]